MKIPLKYTIRSLGTRRLTSALTITGIALVVFVFAAVLMMAYGIQKTMIETGSDANIIVLRKSATAEIMSIVMKDQADVITSLPGIAKAPDGKQLKSGEVVVIINLSYRQKKGWGNVTVRGLPPEGLKLRPDVKLTEGRMFNWGSREIVIGSSIRKRFEGAAVGGKLKFGGGEWLITGIVDANGTAFDSEVWGDIDQLAQAFQRLSAYSSVLVRLEQQGDFDAFRAAFEKDPRIQTLDVKREKQFYAEQSEDMAMFIRILGIVITVIFSAGAMIGAMITMYAAVSNRTIEVGTLRALGFRRMSVMNAFLIESIFIALLGGCAGLLLASLLQFMSISMVNFGTFTELEFSFSLSPEIVVNSLIFSAVMGIIGGFLPSIRAARLNIVSALRGS
jgi:putative ABC transport system permease protein